jgi:hypothetical protein
MPIKVLPMSSHTPTNKSLIEGLRSVDRSAIAAGEPGEGPNRGSFRFSS